MWGFGYLLAGVVFLLLVGTVGSGFSYWKLSNENVAQVLTVYVDNPAVPDNSGGGGNTGGGGSNNNGGNSGGGSGSEGSGGGGGGGGISAPIAIATLPDNTKPVLKEKGDFTGDGKVDIKDFSILAYWYKRTPTAAALAEGVDLNGDGKVTLADFSILAYYWGR